MACSNFDIWVKANDAIFAGNHVELEKLLKSGYVDVNFDPNKEENDENEIVLLNETLLYVAVTRRSSNSFLSYEKGDVEAVNLLLEYGADPNVRSSFGDTPLRKAIFYSNVAIVESLIGAKANAKEECGLGRNLLWYATNKKAFLEHEGRKDTYEYVDALRVIDIVNKTMK